MVYLNFFIITVDFVQKWTLRQSNENSWAALVFDYECFRVLLLLFFFLQKFFIWLFLPYVFTPFNDKRRTKKISSKIWKRYVCPPPKKFFHLYFRNCSLQRSSFRPYKGNWYRPRCFLLNVEFAKTIIWSIPLALGRAFRILIPCAIGY